MTAEPTVVDALALAATVVDEVLVQTVRDTHVAIAGRVHRAVGLGAGPAVRPAELLHNGIAASVYGAIGLTLRGAAKGLEKAAGHGTGPRLEDSPQGRFVNAAVNGLIGEELRRDRPQLAIRMAPRRDGRDVVLTPEGLAAAYPDATDRIVVFVHGLCENESYWGFHRDRTGTTYGEALAARGWTPVHLRYNTGLPIRENGVALAALISRLATEWAVPVSRIALVGHSMGGLVARAALAVQAERAEFEWTDVVTDMVCLGTPHLGAPLAQLAHHGAAALNWLPEARAFGTIIDRRSIGIQDLRRGSDLVADRAHVRYRLVAASLTRSPRHLVARTLGDLLVTPSSAVGRGRRGTSLFPDAETLHVPSTDHFGILNHPDVRTALERWLG